MKKSYVSLALVAACSLMVSACGGGGGGGGGETVTTPVTTPVTVSASTPVLVNYSTTVSANFSGKVDDGATVTFSVSPATAVLTAQTPVTNGIASVRVKSAVRSDVTVAVSSGSFAGSKMVQFIPQPDKAVVHVALNRNIPDLAALTATVKSDLGSVFTAPTSPAVTPSAAYSALLSSSNSFTFDAGQDVYALFLLKLGINVVSGQPVMDIAFTRDPATTTAGIPLFSVTDSAANPQWLSFTNYLNANLGTPSSGTNLAASEFALTTDYYLGTELLATR